MKPAVILYRGVLEARCPTANFVFTKLSDEHIPNCTLDEREEVAVAQLALWLISDTMTPIEYDIGGETEFLRLFKFAEKYNLPEFADFLSVQFAQFIPIYYGGEGRTHMGRVSIDNLAFALNELDNKSAISKFIVEQFIRNWIFGHRYTPDKFELLLDEFPGVLKTLCSRVQEVVNESEEDAVAVFRRASEEDDHDEPTETVDANEDTVAVEPVEDDAPAPPLHQQPAEPHPVTQDPPAGYEYKWIKKRGKKAKRRLVWIGERNNEPSTEGAVPEEAPFADPPEDALALAEADMIVDEPVVASEVVDYNGEPAVEVLEAVESSDVQKESAPESPYDRPVSDDEEDEYSWLKGTGNKPSMAVY